MLQFLESAFEALQNFSPTREYINQTMGIDLTNPSGLFNQRIMEAIRKDFRKQMTNNLIH